MSMVLAEQDEPDFNLYLDGRFSSVLTTAWLTLNNLVLLRICRNDQYRTLSPLYPFIQIRIDASTVPSLPFHENNSLIVPPLLHTQRHGAANLFIYKWPQSSGLFMDLESKA